MSSLFFFCRILLGLFVWPKLDEQFGSQNHRGCCESHSPGEILGYAYIISLLVKYKFLAQFPVDHLVHTVVLTHSVLSSCICLTSYWSFRLYRHIIYICRFIITIIIIWAFLTPASLYSFPLGLNDSMPPQVSRTHFNCQVNLNNAVVLIESNCLFFISKSSSPLAILWGLS